MPAGKDTGLDRPKWNYLDPSITTAQRRDSITGVDAQTRNTRTYL